MYALWMTLKWIRRWARFLDVKLRLDHTLSQSTDKLRSDNSLFQIVLIERGFVIQSIILLYIKGVIKGVVDCDFTFLTLVSV